MTCAVRSRENGSYSSSLMLIFMLTGFLGVTFESVVATPSSLERVALEVDSSVLSPPPYGKKLPGSCFTWAGSHYKSFDGKVYR